MNVTSPRLTLLPWGRLPADYKSRRSSTPSSFLWQDHIGEGATLLKELSALNTTLQDQEQEDLASALKIDSAEEAGLDISSLSLMRMARKNEQTQTLQYVLNTLIHSTDAPITPALELQTSMLKEPAFLKKCWLALRPHEKTALLNVLQSDTCIQIVAQTMEQAPSSLFLKSWSFLLQYSSNYTVDLDETDTPTLQIILAWFDAQQAAGHKTPSFHNKIKEEVSRRLLDDLAYKAQKESEEALKKAFKGVDAFYELIRPVGDGTSRSPVIQNPDTDFISDKVAHHLSRFIFNEEEQLKQKGALLKRQSEKLDGEKKEKLLKLRQEILDEIEKLKSEDEQLLSYLIDYLPNFSLTHVDHCIEQCSKILENPLHERFPHMQAYERRLNDIRTYLQQHRHLAKMKEQAERKAHQLKYAFYGLARHTKISPAFNHVLTIDKTAANLPISGDTPAAIRKPSQKNINHFERVLKEFENTLMEFWGCSAAKHFDSQKSSSDIIPSTVSFQDKLIQNAALKKQNQEQISDRLEALLNEIEENSTAPIHSANSIWPTSYLSQFVNTEIRHVLSQVSDNIQTSTLDTQVHDYLQTATLEEVLATIASEALRIRVRSQVGDLLQKLTLEQALDTISSELRESVFSHIRTYLQALPLNGVLAAISPKSLHRLQNAYDIPQIPNIELNTKVSLFQEITKRISSAIDTVKNLPAISSSFEVLEDRLHTLDILRPPSLKNFLVGPQHIAEKLNDMVKELGQLPAYLGHFYEKIEALPTRYWSDSDCNVSALEKYLSILTRAHHYQPSNVSIELGRFKNIVHALQEKLQVSCEEQVTLFYTNIIEGNANYAIEYFQTLFSSQQKLMWHKSIKAKNTVEAPSAKQFKMELEFYIDNAIKTFSPDQKEKLLSILGSDATTDLQNALFAAATSIQINRPQKSAQLLALGKLCIPPIGMNTDADGTTIDMANSNLMEIEPASDITPQTDSLTLFNIYREAIQDHLHIDIGPPDTSKNSISTDKLYYIGEDLIPKNTFESIYSEFQKTESLDSIPVYVGSIPNIDISPQYMQDAKRDFISEIYIHGEEYKFSSLGKKVFLLQNKHIYSHILLDFCKYHENFSKSQDEFRLLSFWLSQSSCIIDTYLGKTEALTVQGLNQPTAVFLGNAGERAPLFHLDRQYDGSVLLKIVFQRFNINTAIKVENGAFGDIIQFQPDASSISSEISVRIDINNPNQNEKATILPNSGKYKYSFKLVQNQEYEALLTSTNSIPRFVSPA